jgi:hypothetical protein
MIVKGKQTIYFESKRMARNFQCVLVFAGSINPDRIKVTVSPEEWKGWTSVNYPATKTTRIVTDAFLFGKRGYGI